MPTDLGRDSEPSRIFGKLAVGTTPGRAYQPPHSYLNVCSQKPVTDNASVALNSVFIE